mgnify:CR=1|tara:strand:- start:1628 stop:2014 length:387 start_codon:yes stop_codon:yes gene_type:complete
MFQRKPRRFRRRSNGRGQSSHNNGYIHHGRPRLNSFSNNQTRNNFRAGQSAEKLLEKYNNLAKEALSSGDETSCENYLQHADHFIRIIEDKNKSRENSKVEINSKEPSDEKHSPENNDIKKENETNNT